MRRSSWASLQSRLATAARLCAVALVGFTAVDLAADGFIQARPADNRPAIREGVRPPSYPLQVRHHKVAVEIAGGLAQTAIDQVFLNPHSLRLEGTYLFPVPHGAAISQFSMDVGGTQMSGEVQEATPARATYESIVREVKDPAILEYVGTRLVTMRIFPLEPHAAKPVNITYSQTLTPQAGLVTYCYPLNTEKFSATPLEEVEVVVNIAEDCPIGAIYSPSHAVAIERTGPGRAVVRYRATQVTPERDFILCYQRATEDLSLSMLAHRSGRNEGYFAAMVSPAASREARAPADLVVAIDTSSSMGESGKIAHIERALALCLDRLSPRDRFEIVDFSTVARRFGGRGEGLIEATPANIERARRHLAGLSATGGTHLQDAMAMVSEILAQTAAAPSPRPLAVMLITDGSPTIGARELAPLSDCLAVDGRTPHRLFVLGVGDEVDTSLLDGLAERHGGFARYASADADLPCAIASFFDGVALPAVRDAKLVCETAGVDLFDLQPGRVGDLFPGGSTVILGRYRGAGAVTVRLEGQVDGAPYVRRFQLDLDRASDHHGLIAHLHARRQVGEFLARIRNEGEQDDLKAQVAALARRHGILTPYTSFLVLEDDAMWKQRFVASRGPSVINPRSKLDAPQAAATSAFDLTFNAASRAGAREAITATTGAGGLAVRREVDSMRVSSPLERDDRNAAAAVRRVGEQVFYRDAGGRWVDSRCTDEQVTGARKVAFLSDAYFALLGVEPGCGPYLAIGESVVFAAADGRAIEIVAR